MHEEGEIEPEEGEIIDDAPAVPVQYTQALLPTPRTAPHHDAQPARATVPLHDNRHQQQKHSHAAKQQDKQQNKAQAKRERKLDKEVNKKIAKLSSDSSHTPCKYYAIGRCRLGDTCNYYHDASIRVKYPQPCCTRGADCMYSHDLGSMPCMTYAYNNKCNRSGCPYRHQISDEERQEIRDGVHVLCARKSAAPLATGVIELDPSAPSDIQTDMECSRRLGLIGACPEHVRSMIFREPPLLPSGDDARQNDIIVPCDTMDTILMSNNHAPQYAAVPLQSAVPQSCLADLDSISRIINKIRGNDDDVKPEFVL